MVNRLSGDGFVVCSDGHTRWGRFGAAGMVFVVRPGAMSVPDPGSVPPSSTVCLQLRSRFAHEGGTWSCPGGALDEGETPFEGAWRESGEEIGIPPEPWRLLGEHVFEPATDWRYTTSVVEVARPFGSSLNFETDEVAWVPLGEVDRLPLHPGFAAAWPHLHAIIDAAA